MAQPTLPPDNNALYSLIEIICVCGTFITVIWRWIDAYFKSLRDNKREFIRDVVIETVRATLDGELKGIREDIKELRDWREADRSHLDEKFSKLMTEIKK